MRPRYTGIGFAPADTPLRAIVALLGIGLIVTSIFTGITTDKLNKFLSGGGTINGDVTLKGELDITTQSMNRTIRFSASKGEIEFVDVKPVFTVEMSPEDVIINGTATNMTTGGFERDLLAVSSDGDTAKFGDAEWPFVGMCGQSTELASADGINVNATSTCLTLQHQVAVKIYQNGDLRYITNTAATTESHPTAHSISVAGSARVDADATDTQIRAPARVVVGHMGVDNLESTPTQTTLNNPVETHIQWGGNDGIVLDTGALHLQHPSNVSMTVNGAKQFESTPAKNLMQHATSNMIMTGSDVSFNADTVSATVSTSGGATLRGGTGVFMDVGLSNRVKSDTTETQLFHPTQIMLVTGGDNTLTATGAGLALDTSGLATMNAIVGTQLLVGGALRFDSGNTKTLVQHPTQMMMMTGADLNWQSTAGMLSLGSSGDTMFNGDNSVKATVNSDTRLLSNADWTLMQHPTNVTIKCQDMSILDCGAGVTQLSGVSGVTMGLDANTLMSVTPTKTLMQHPSSNMIMTGSDATLTATTSTFEMYTSGTATIRGESVTRLLVNSTQTVFTASSISGFSDIIGSGAVRIFQGADLRFDTGPNYSGVFHPTDVRLATGGVLRLQTNVASSYLEHPSDVYLSRNNIPRVEVHAPETRISHENNITLVTDAQDSTFNAADGIINMRSGEVRLFDSMTGDYASLFRTFGSSATNGRGGVIIGEQFGEVQLGQTANSYTERIFLEATTAITASVAITSDMQLKQNATQLDDTDSLAKIKQINPISFHWKPEYYPTRTEKQLGLSANELQAIDADLVVCFDRKIFNKDTQQFETKNICHIKEDSVVAMLIGAVKRLEARLAAVEGP